MEFKGSFTDKRGVTGEITVNLPLVKSTEKERDKLIHLFCEECHRIYLEMATAINEVNKMP